MWSSKKDSPEGRVRFVTIHWRNGEASIRTVDDLLNETVPEKKQARTIWV